MKTESRFAKKTRELRMDRGRSQEQLAEIADIATRTVQRVEKDQTRDGETLQAIAAAFDVTVKDLRTDYLVPESKPPKSLMIESADDFRVARKRPKHFKEPFAGGGIVSLTVAAENLADRVTMVERDEQVAAVWEVIIVNESDAEWLAEAIIKFDLTSESLAEVLASNPRSVRQRAFQTILKNRTYHGGILAAGSAPLKHGENGKGIRSRWYADTLKRRILDIIAWRDRITFVQEDGIEVMRRNARKRNAAFFIDPPYTAGGKRAGRRLYTHSEIDHEKLFEVTSKVAGDFLMTYDQADDVRELASKYNFDTELVAMKNTHHAAMRELLIGRDLDWARQ